MRVLGTAGHVDHGKSTLVRALSGIDPDRLKEEKARGMTIDLGFAWITLARAGAPPGAEPESVGIVDVPGHIDFIKNMLAGVGGIDAVMLVIAADEGVMPQTREHLAILDLLAVPTGVVVLSKVDLVDDPDWLDLVELDVAALLEGTRLAHAPVVRVSASTGAGLDELRAVLAGQLAELPPRRNRARPRLPVDRVFTLSGFGTVVTGTLLDGTLALGDSVGVLPGGQAARVRGLQTHKQQVALGQPGSRLAVNLGGVSADEVRRGDVIALSGSLQPTSLVDVRFRLLSDAPVALRHNAAVDFFSGAAEIPAHARVLGAEQVAPGGEGWLQLRLARPTVVAAGDHFILRLPSPSVTLGGGTVVNANPARRWRRFDAEVLARLQTLAHGAPDEVLLELLERTPFVTVKQLLAASELPHDAASEALASLRAGGAVVELGQGEPLFCTLGLWQRLSAALAALAAETHRQFPLRAGLPRGEVRSRLQSLLAPLAVSPRLTTLLVERAVAERTVGASENFIWAADFVITPTAEQQAAVKALLAAYAVSPALPPNAVETLALLGGEGELLEMLLAQGVLLRLGSDVYFRPGDFARLMEQVLDHVRAHGSITLAEARDLLQTSRKYAQSLLEELDARRLTRREGDLRVLR